LTPEGRSPAVERLAEIPRPAFWGPRVFESYKLDEIFPYLNETALFKNQWQLKNAAQGDYLRLVEEKYRPVLLEFQKEVKAAGWFEPKSISASIPAPARATS
jgi:5-methyltetrahydrofolate--homocysteine methyltransferase